jgi:hypothetical protein
MSCEIFVQFLSMKYVFALDKSVSFIARCTLCIAQVESVEVEGVIRRTGRRPPA